MRQLAILAAIVCVPVLLVADDKDTKPLTPAEAAKKVNEKCTVEMEVKSSGMSSSGRMFLNSEADRRSDKNFTIMIEAKSLEKFKKAGIESPPNHYKGKTIRVTGTVTLFMDRPQIAVTEPEQIQLVEKK